MVPRRRSPPNPRRLVAAAHRWTGLVLGGLLMFVAATGGLMAWRSSLEPWSQDRLGTATHCESEATMDATLASARIAHPTGAIDMIRVFARDEQNHRRLPTQVRFRDGGAQDTLFMDPCTAGVLVARPRFGGFFGTLEQLHRFRFVAGLGWVPGVLALVLAGMVAAGLFLWWPRGRRTMRDALRLDRRLQQGPGRRLDLHRVVGLYVGPIVLLSALTGLPQAYDWAARGVYLLAGSSGPAAKPRASSIVAPSQTSTSTQKLTPTQAFDRVVAMVPQFRDIAMRFPVRAADPIEAIVIERAAPHANARTSVYLDPRDGRTLGFTPYAEAGSGARLYWWTLSWHTGEIGGPVGPLVLSIGALGLLVLGYAGAASDFGRRRAGAASANRTARS